MTRYIGRHGTKRVAKAVLISAIPPHLLKTGANQREFRQKCGMASAPVSPRILVQDVQSLAAATWSQQNKSRTATN